MSEEKKVYYKPKVRIKNALIFIIVFSFFPLIGLAAVLTGALVPGLVVILFGVLILLYLIFRVSAIDKKYALSEKSIYLQNLYAKRSIVFDELEYITFLDKESLIAFLNQYLGCVVEAERNYRLGAWYKNSAAYSRLQSFLSITVTQTTVSKGNSRNITRYGTHADEDVLLLKLRSGERFLISPENPEELLNEILLHGVKKRAVADVLATLKEESGDIPVKSRPMSKALTIYRWASLAVILAALALYFIYNYAENRKDPREKPAAEQSAPSEGNEQKDRLIEVLKAMPAPGLAGYQWLDDSTFQISVLDSSLRENEHDGGITSRMFDAFAARAAIIDYLVEQKEQAIPAIDDDWIKDVGQSLMLFSRMTVAGKGKLKDGSPYTLYNVSGNGLSDLVNLTVRKKLEGK